MQICETNHNPVDERIKSCPMNDEKRGKIQAS